MRELHKSRYTQAIPGINRIDDHVRFTQGEKCLNFFGDVCLKRFALKSLKKYGLACVSRSLRSNLAVPADVDSCCSAGVPFQDKLLADAANAHQRGRHTKLWCETTTKTAESNIRDTYGARDAKLRQWKEHLNKEVDKLALEIARVESFQREVVRRRQYLSDVIRASDMTANFRKSLPDKGEDHIGLMQKEVSATSDFISTFEYSYFN
ncbi:tektin [Caerostris darwini]|uniref:Tektin n=1 Tax=Caerostris darwini TaxID=1538125 RepID=A0AAV4TAM4_9ARAC|nr:tektin [Caerostris darwini]